VRYRMISQDLALLNEVPQGAYIVEVVSGSPADKAGVKVGDIITKLDGEPLLEENGGLAKIISQKKIGDWVKLTIWRNGETLELETTLEEFKE
ncbi:MAG TPA: PDZ domain-containing protein, partial [Nevskiaceae bacterium]|nr:PDZ domain-containing protein [Nevskiaceae bacterium]